MSEVMIGSNKIILGDEVYQLVQIERLPNKLPFTIVLKYHFREVAQLRDSVGKHRKLDHVEFLQVDKQLRGRSIH